MQAKHWLDYLTAFGAITTPILVLVLTGIGWKVRRSFDRQLELEDKLRDKRIETYNHILEPFIILLMSDAAWSQDSKNKGKDKGEHALKQLLSLEYRRQGFRLSLVGTDEVVRSYNNLMQFFYAMGDSATPTDGNLKSMMSLLGQFLLEIRKSTGNESSGLTNWEMLEWFMTDARKLSKS